MKLPFSKDDIIELHGQWDLGYALSLHSISSTPIDPNHHLFDTSYTELGKLVKLFKYKGRLDLSDDLAHCAVNAIKSLFLIKGHRVDVITTPPSTIKQRSYQPAEIIANKVSNLLGIRYKLLFIKDEDDDVPVKNIPFKSKKLSHLQDSLNCRYQELKSSKRVLIFDDIFDSGATLEVCTDILRRSGCSKVYILTLTKTRKY